jgi:hypothetical protein
VVTAREAVLCSVGRKRVELSVEFIEGFPLPADKRPMWSLRIAALSSSREELHARLQECAVAGVSPEPSLLKRADGSRPAGRGTRDAKVPVGHHGHRMTEWR